MSPSPALAAALRLLDLPASASERDVMEARRRLAKRWHPDVGGTEARMQELNEAVTVVMRSVVGRRPGPGTTSRGAAAPRRADRPAPGRARTDHPSFTIDVAPWQAAIAVVEAGEILGRIVVDESPHEVDVVVSRPACWTRLALAPEGASTVVSLTVAPVGRTPPPDLDDVRDLWIAALNDLDWDRIAPPPPS